MKLFNKKQNGEDYIDGVTLTAVISCGAIIIVSLFLLFVHIQKQKYGTSILEGWKKSSQTTSAPKTNPFASLSVEAKAAYVYDVAAGKVLYSKNENDSLPLASLTKIMTAVTALTTTSPTKIITISKDDLAADGDTGLRSGETWSLSKLLQFTLLVSSNDGAQAVASAIGGVSATFVTKMNDEAAKQNLASMHFSNATGLDLSTTTAGAFGSAKDVAVLFANAFQQYPDIFGITKYSAKLISSQSGITHDAENTDEIVNHVMGLRASKTGFTDLAGGNLVIEFDVEPSHPVVAVVLGSSYDGRFRDMEKLVQATYNSIQ